MDSLSREFVTIPAVTHARMFNAFCGFLLLWAGPVIEEIVPVPDFPIAATFKVGRFVCVGATNPIPFRDCAGIKVFAKSEFLGAKLNT